MTIRFGPLLVLRLALPTAGAGVDAVGVDVVDDGTVGEGEGGVIAGGGGAREAALVAGAVRGKEIEGDLAAAGGFGGHGGRDGRRTDG